MRTFKKENLNHIKAIFEERTGVELGAEKAPHHGRAVVRGLLVAAAILCCLTATVLAGGLFSSLEGDEVAFDASYEGNGLVTVEVENRSDKVLHFQETMKLIDWSYNVEVERLSDEIVFTGTKIAPHSTGVMTIDLSKAYNLEALESPEREWHRNWYMLALTNNDFAYGQDWQVSIRFVSEEFKPEPTPQPEFVPMVMGPAETTPEEFRDYFEERTLDIQRRSELTMQYMESVRKYLDAVERPGCLVEPTDPLVITLPLEELELMFDESLPEEEQRQLVGCHTSSFDVDMKLLGRHMDDDAYKVSAYLVANEYGDVEEVPLFYIFAFDKDAIQSGEDYAFIRGEIRTFDELEPCKVYEDEEFVCYEISAFVWDDLEEYVAGLEVRWTDIDFDEAAMNRLWAIHDYFKDNWGEAIRVREGYVPGTISDKVGVSR